MQPRRKFRVGICSRVLVLAALFWLLMQAALVPSGKDGQGLRATSTRRILYVHIGKTGGEWVKSQLSISCKTRKNKKVKEACQKEFQAPGTSSHLSQETVGYLHVNSIYPKNGHQLATHYLFSIRHPLARLVSWYVYNHPKSCEPRESNSPACKKNEWKTRFFDCFPTLEDLGSPALLAESSTDCPRVFWGGWNGRVESVKDPNHLYWNYQFYWNNTKAQSPKRPIFAVRQESLRGDMDALEAFLSNNGGLSTTFKWKEPDTRHFLSGRVNRELSTQATRTLCCVLEDEMSVYQAIVQEAENLNEEEKQHTLVEALKICKSMGSWEELKCPGLPQYAKS